MGRLVFLIAACAVVAGCGGSKHGAATPPIRPKQWQAVVNDWLNNGQMNGTHSCGAVVEAVAHMDAMGQLPSDDPNLRVSSRRAIFVFDRYATRVCPRMPQLSKIVVGMSDAAVAAVAGMPRTPRLRCWLYPVTSAHDGRRVCFVHGRVSLVQHSIHL